MPATTRFYFSSTTAAPVSPAFDADWGVTGSAVRRKLKTTPAGSGASGSVAVSETSASVIDVLNGQFVSDGGLLPVGPITGTFDLVMSCRESGIGQADMYQQIRIHVFDSTGTTKRGTIYDGQTTTSVSATASDPNAEFAFSAQETRILVNIPLVPGTTAQAADILVVEHGCKACNVSTTSRTATIDYRDDGVADHTLTAGLTANGRPWLELHLDVDAVVAAPAATATADAIAPSLTADGTIPAPAATATAAALPPAINEVPEPTEAHYTADIVIGDHEFTITSGDCDLDNPIQVLDNLTIGWEVSESNPWPAQPDPVSCKLGLWTADVVNLEDVVIGTPMSVVLRDIDDNVFGTFHGRVGSQAAAPLRNGPGALAMRYALTGVDYIVDLAELSLTLVDDWPAETATARFDRIAAILSAVGITFDPPPDTGTATFESYPATSTSALALIQTHLDQIAIDNGNGPERYIVVPVIVADVLDRFSCILLERSVDAGLLPATLDVVDGILTLVFASLAAEGVVDACAIDLDLVWNRLKYRAVNQVTVAGETVTAHAERPGPPVRLALDTTLTDQDAADRMAQMYLPDVDESNGWIADSFHFYGHRRPASLVPAWFPDHRDDPAGTSVYVMPLAILNIPPNINLAGNGTVYAGQLVNVELSIVTQPKPQILVDFALRRQLPISAGGDEITWEWLAIAFPTVTWDDVDPDLSWYDIRIARRP